jgi:GH24 family phage-related lysozyme (muramidase)
MNTPTPIEHLDAELEVEEGDRQYIYDDATGKTFQKGDTLKGNLSAGIGINLMTGFDAVELQFIEQNRIAKVQAGLAKYLVWYAALDPVRQVALADIAYNIGVAGLLRWPHFLSFMAKQDYASAVAEIRSDQLWTSQVGPARAGRLETMIETGNWPADITVPGAPS